MVWDERKPKGLGPGPSQIEGRMGEWSPQAGASLAREPWAPHPHSRALLIPIISPLIFVLWSLSFQGLDWAKGSLYSPGIAPKGYSVCICQETLTSTVCKGCSGAPGPLRSCSLTASPGSPTVPEVCPLRLPWPHHPSTSGGSG